MTAIWQARLTQTAARYGEHAPMAAVCCNACRTCATTNVLALATGLGLGALYGVWRLGRRLAPGGYAFWLNQHPASRSR